MVDTRHLKCREPSGSYRFESGSGHYFMYDFKHVKQTTEDTVNMDESESNPHHIKLTDGREAGVSTGPNGASAFVTIRRNVNSIVGRRPVYVTTGRLDGATRHQAIDVLEQALLDALDDVRALR